LHKKKRQLKGHLRQKVASQLLDNKQDVSTWSSNKVKDLMNNGDPILSILYNTTLLQKAKQQRIRLLSRIKALRFNPQFKFSKI